MPLDRSAISRSGSSQVAVEIAQALSPGEFTTLKGRSAGTRPAAQPARNMHSVAPVQAEAAPVWSPFLPLACQARSVNNPAPPAFPTLVALRFHVLAVAFDGTL